MPPASLDRPGFHEWFGNVFVGTRRVDEGILGFRACLFQTKRRSLRLKVSSLQVQKPASGFTILCVLSRSEWMPSGLFSSRALHKQPRVFQSWNVLALTANRAQRVSSRDLVVCRYAIVAVWACCTANHCADLQHLSIGMDEHRPSRTFGGRGRKQEIS